MLKKNKNKINPLRKQYLCEQLLVKVIDWDTLS